MAAASAAGDPVKPALLSAISQLQNDRLRDVLRQAIEKSDAVSTVLASFLLVYETQVPDVSQEEDEEEDEEEVEEDGCGQHEGDEVAQATKPAAAVKSETKADLPILKRKWSEEDVKEPVSNGNRALQPVHNPPPTKKLKARYLVCHQCNKDYDVTENNKEACKWHSGELEQDDSEGFWDDHEEDHYGLIEDLKDEYPEGFKWDCCGKSGLGDGCRVGRHMP